MKNKKYIEAVIAYNQTDIKASTDVLGSYTGVPACAEDENPESLNDYIPTQDADDL